MDGGEIGSGDEGIEMMTDERGMEDEGEARGGSPTHSIPRCAHSARNRRRYLVFQNTLQCSCMQVLAVPEEGVEMHQSPNSGAPNTA